jgi:hypothetical protein
MHALVVTHKQHRCLGPCQISSIESFFFSTPLEILCFRGDGSCSPSPLAKKINMYLVENMFNIVCKDKCLAHFFQGNVIASTSKTIGNDLVPIIELIQDLLLKKKKRELNWVFQDVWAIKFLWAKAIIGNDGKMT